MITAVPLTILPLLLYNAVMLGVAGAGVASLPGEVLAFDMLSGARWSLSLGDVLVLVALAVLFAEIVKATRSGSGSLLNHLLSMLVFIAFLVEFLLVRNAATQTFFILMVIAFIDVAGGFIVSIRTAARDVSIGL